MSRFSSILLCSLLTVSFIGCSKSNGGSSAPATFESVRQLVHERSVLGHELDVMGYPDESWPPERIQEFEAKINRLEAVENLLRASRENVELNEHIQYNVAYIAQSRHQIAEYRAHKHTERVSYQ